MKSFEAALRGRKIFITGHTGFTGSWAAIWLNDIGAQVMGYSLSPKTTPNLFTLARIEEFTEGAIADIRDFENLRERISSFQPDLVLHLAAQPLVRASYLNPRETFEINVQGTANVLEACRGVDSIKGILCITTDKVYKNNHLDRGYRESDELGGLDPYSFSKVAAEFVISSYKFSNLVLDENGPKIAVARGGNIIGGGDWSDDRLIPDFMRAHESKSTLDVRNLNATRPWQHVISLVDGYFTILSGLLGPDADRFSRPFNLGPLDSSQGSVGDVLLELEAHFPEVEIRYQESNLPESEKLSLDSTLAASTFGWNPAWDTSKVIAKTSEWYKEYFAGETAPLQLCRNQIKEWTES